MQQLNVRGTLSRGPSAVNSVIAPLAAALISYVAATGVTYAASAEPRPTPTHMSRPIMRMPQDGDPFARRAAVADLIAPYMTEDYKTNFLRELARKQALYPNQMAGANYPAGIPVWRSIGPRTSKYSWNGIFIDGIDSGRIRTILTDPRNADHVYVLTSGGGLWTTNNFSAIRPNWKVVTDALLSTSGGSVAFGHDPDTLYLGVGDPFDVYPAVAGVIVKSTDGGHTWGAFVNLPGATSVRDVKVDTSGSSDVVLVATDAGLFVSTNGGATYALSSVGQSSAKYDAWSIVRSRAGWLLSAVDPTFEVASGTGELYLSRDHGATWNAIAAGGDVFTAIGRATLAIANPGEKVVYAIGSDQSGFLQSDVYRSTNGGRSWTALNVTAGAPTNPNCFQPDLNILGDQAWYNQMIVVSPQDRKRNTLYIGGNLSTAKTTDGGRTWTLTSSWLPAGCDDNVTPQLPYVHADNHAAAILATDGVERLVFGTDGGIFVSEDGGQSFDSSKNTGIVALLAQTISSTPRRDDSAITGLQDTGTRARIGSSAIWNQVSGGDGEGVGWSQANNAVTIVTAEFDYILHQPGLPANTGSPNNWQDGTNGLDFNDLDCFPFYTPIATPSAKVDPTGLLFYTVTGSRLYKTTDGAASWAQVTQFGTVAEPQCIIRLSWHNIGLHPTDPKRIALGGTTGRVIISQDGGANWGIIDLIALVPGYTGSNSAPGWARNGTTLYMASESPDPGAVRLVKSTDGGSTWNRADGVQPDKRLPDVAVSDIVVDPRNPQGRTVYAATSIGVYVTHNGGDSWSLFGAGLPNVSVRGLYLSPDEEFIRIATYGRGVWEIDTKD